MNDTKSRVGSDAVKLTASKIITTLIGLISSMLLSRFRTLTEYGTYSQLLMTINLACSLFMLGLPNSINYFLVRAKTDEERDKFLSVYYTLSTFLSIMIGLILILSCPLLEKFFKNDLIKFFWYFMALYPWTRVITSSVENLLIVYKKTSALALFRVLNSAMILGIILIIQWAGGSFNHYMIFWLCEEVVFTVWVYIIAKKNSNRLKISFNRKLIKKIFAFSVPIGLAAMIGTINIELDKLVIASFLSTEKLAIYSNASKELPVNIIAASLTAVLMPQVVKLMQFDRKEDAVKLWKSATSISFAIISLIALGCFVFAPEVITILYSAKYLDGVGVFRIYCLVLFLRCTYFGMMLNATGNTKAVMYSSIGSLVTNISLNYLCFYIFGFIGPAIATVISMLTMALYQLIYTCKKLKISFLTIFPWKNCCFFLALNIILSIFFYFTKDMISKRIDINNIFLSVILGAVWTIAFAVISIKQLKKQWRYLNQER